MLAGFSITAAILVADMPQSILVEAGMGMLMSFALCPLARDHMHSLFPVVKQRLRQWTKPDTRALILNAAREWSTWPTQNPPHGGCA